MYTASFLDDFFDKSKCCGCGACVSSCPANALSMSSDELGFKYPKIDREKCIHCGLCEKVCNYKKENAFHDPLHVFACASNSNDYLFQSSSGGLFSELARTVLEKNGVVFGARYWENKDCVTLKHESIEKISELHHLTGSKYLQSSTEESYKDVKQFLNQGRMVLFCGTPCQIDGLYGYLQKDYKNLITIDIACHGVPSQVIFNDYIQYLKKRYNAEKIEFTFRDKRRNGWGHGAIITIEKKSGVIIHKRLSYRLSSYYTTFMKSQLIRECCYSCKYASQNRPADITLGDFWGINKSHPEMLKRNGGLLDDEKGISFVFLNTTKGVSLFEMCRENISVYESSVDNVVKNNPAMCCPPLKPNNRVLFIRKYIEQGYDGIEEEFRRYIGKEYYILMIKNFVPFNVQKRLLRLLRKR